MTIQKWPYLGDIAGVTHWLVVALDGERRIARKQVVEGAQAANDLMREWQQ